VAFHAGLASLRRVHFLEAQDRAGFLTAAANVLASRPVAGFTRLVAMDVGFVVSDVRFMADHAQLIVLDILCLGNRWNGSADRRVFLLSPKAGTGWTAGSGWFPSTRKEMPRPTAGEGAEQTNT